ncbi:ABEC1 enzyme, partial [Alcedo cyanopectus]|nr:ABEC1 enzyme [Ceyx cyanopectus]
KTIFQEYLTNQGTVVKPCRWQRQSHVCAECPYHVRTGEEARVPYAEFQRLFGFPHRSVAALRNKHLLFYELRSFSGRVVQKGHATNCTDQNRHPESMLFEAGGYLDAVTDAYENIRCITLYSNYSPCNEAYHCCISQIYNFVLKHPQITLCIYFSQLYHTEDGCPTAAWNREALRSLSSLWPWVTLRRLPGRSQPYLLSNFVYGIPESTFSQPTQQNGQNPRRINDFIGIKPCFREDFPQAMQGRTAAQQNLKNFSSANLSPQQPFQGSNQLPPMSQSHLVLCPGRFLPFQRDQLYPRPKNIVRHLKMPME